MRRLWWIVPWLAGCGSEVVAPPSEGMGGRGAATSATTSSSGGPIGCTTTADCPPASDGEATPFCQFPDGACEGPGTCVEHRGVMFGCLASVCGCDGVTYCNRAAAALDGGVSVVTSGECDAPPPPIETALSAEAWAGGLDHMVLRRADFLHDTCTVVFAAAPSEGMFAIEIGEPWGVDAIVQSAGAASCIESGPPSAESQGATSAVGSVVGATPATNVPCELTLDFTATFAPPVAGPATVAFAGTVDVVGCY